MTSDTSTPRTRLSAADWLLVRRHVRTHRAELTAAAARRYPDHVHLAGTGLLAHPSFLPERPVPLDAIALTLHDDWPAPDISARSPEADGVLPIVEQDTGDFRDYYQAVAALDPPRLFENRPLYRLTSVNLADTSPTLEFADGTYFDAAGLGDAVGHEFAAAAMAGDGATPLRDAIGDPCDPRRRCMPLAVSALTLRQDRATGTASFPLHWRDPALVAHAGGMYHAIPSGMFQAAGPGALNRAADFDLWLGMVREYAEEMAGAAEVEADPERGMDYAGWPFAAAMQQARAEGKIRAHTVGLGVDPLTLAVDLLAVFVFDDDVYDHLFGGGPVDNEEGRLVTGAQAGPAAGSGANDQSAGYAFDSATIAALLASAPLQPGGAALLALADRHRDVLLG
ncbi:hypothetical protein GCM10009839_54960 [Catenulispora yoronensis]|uniref:Uncharacterized protein n=1 Tax=Catenulispora yoronensis TaxID=450799 RepID=A0ABN2UVF2_9ACTN